MSSDTRCAEIGGSNVPERFVVNNGKFANVFVYLKGGPADRYKFPAATEPKELDQHGCRYVPHVFGIQVGQTLEILSSDNTLHNVHAMPQQNREFNMAHQLAGIKHTHVFTTKEVMVPFKCDVHKWMNAYLGVLDHPFYAVTSGDGRFELKGLPPGTYTIEAWHERLGPMTQSVTVAASETKDVPFTFNPGAPAATD